MTFSPPTAPTALHDQLQYKLLALQDKAWLPSELLDLISFTALAQAESRKLSPSLESITALRLDPIAHAQGAPLLDKEDFPIDVPQAAQLFMQILQKMLTQENLQEPASNLYAHLDLAHAEPEKALYPAFTAILQDNQEYFSHWAQQIPHAPRLMYFLAYNSLVPSLEAIAAHLQPHIGDMWAHGHCPVCGSAPFMGYLGKKSGKDKSENLLDTNGQRFHVCSFCRSEYRVKRLQCPFCLEEDHTKLEYFSAAEDPDYQVHVCHSCKGYIKLADFREYTSRPMLPAVDDLASLPLDIAAQQQGYSRLTLSPWGF